MKTDRSGSLLPRDLMSDIQSAAFKHNQCRIDAIPDLRIRRHGVEFLAVNQHNLQRLQNQVILSENAAVW